MSKRKGRAARDVEVNVIQETSASEGEDGSKGKAKEMAADTRVLSESDVEIVEAKDLQDHQNLGIDKAVS